MVKIIQKVKLTNSFHIQAYNKKFITIDKIKSKEIDMLVDTWAAMICLPLSIIRELELQKIDDKKVQTANGIVNRGIFEPVKIEIFDRFTILPVMELPDDNTPAFLGYLPLEALDLYPNPKKQILEGNPKYDGKMVVDLF